MALASSNRRSKNNFGHYPPFLQLDHVYRHRVAPVSTPIHKP